MIAETKDPYNNNFQQSKNVTELWLSNNQINAVHNIDLAGLYNLKELLLDTNNLEYFDPTTLLGNPHLTIFNIGHNEKLKIPFGELAS